MTALQKPRGGTRGIDVGDFVVARTLRLVNSPCRPSLGASAHEKQCCRGSQRWKVAAVFCLSSGYFTAPLQCVGGPTMQEALMRCGRGRAENRATPLCPLCTLVANTGVLVHVSEELLDSERLFAFMDDVYVCCGPDRVAAIHQLLGREMWDRARIQLHQGKTQFWNRGGTFPHGWEAMTAVARVRDPTAVLWKGDSSLPPSEQGLRIGGSVRRTVRFWSVRLVVAPVLRGNGGKLPLDGHSTGTGFGVRHQPHSLSTGEFDKDLGCRSPPRVVGSC